MYLRRVSTECAETKVFKREWLLEENATMDIAVLVVWELFRLRITNQVVNDLQRKSGVKVQRV